MLPLPGNDVIGQVFNRKYHLGLSMYYNGAGVISTKDGLWANHQNIGKDLQKFKTKQQQKMSLETAHYLIKSFMYIVVLLTI